MVQQEDLIASKLEPPVRDARAISRAALAETARDLLRAGGLVTVVAPGGSGKSSLMTELHQAVAQEQIDASWLGLDAQDNDPATFALYFIRAVQAIEPRFARDEQTALRANPVRDFDALFDLLHSRLGQSVRHAVIFLDDFQHISDQQILRFLNRLLAQRPSGLSLVLASRHELPLEYARLLVAGQVVEIGPESLNFSHAEMSTFLERYHAVQLSESDLQALDDSTEGWPTGVQLIGLALRRHKGPAADLIHSFSGRDRDLTRYLVESILKLQPERVRQFLLQTSPLRRMSADLCIATTGNSDAPALLEQVGQANLFLISLDREGRWFRYHHLFAEFLQSEFRRRDDAGFRQTCLRAANWCETRGYPSEAVRYALEAEQFEQAVDLIARNAMRVSMFDGDHYTVRDWMRNLPEAYHLHRPEILLSHAWSCAFSRDTQHALALSQQAIDLLDSEEASTWSLSEEARERWLLWALNVQAATHACSDDIEDCIRRSAALLPRVPDSEPFLLATLANCLSYSYFARREFEDSRHYALMSHEQGHRADAHYLSAWGDFLHGLTLVESGNLNAAGELARSVQKDSEGLGLGQRSYVAGLAALLSASIAIQRGDFATTAEHIDVGRAFKDIFGPVQPQLVALQNEARLHVSRQQTEKAYEVLRDGQVAALREQHRRLYVALAVEEAALQLTADDVERARNTLRRTGLLPADRKSNSLSRAQRDGLKLLDAGVHLAEGDARPALRLLTSLQQGRGAETRGGFALAVTTHRAIALWDIGSEKEAARQLDRALVAAADEFHVYPILSAGKKLLPLLDYLAEKRPAAASESLGPVLELQNWLRDYLGGSTHGPPPTGASAPQSVTERPEILTSRELEILRHLQAGLTNRQLADGLILSVPTVKWHLHNIYSKLGVGNRGAAVAAALRQNIL
ncbi:MAG: hypothetical protein CMN28_14300 [Salinisphaeraceae bacterium]|nr:hypothetical protein [Salinisphaeraceae bacterium]